MLQLNKQEQEVFLKLARSQDAEILKDYIQRLIDEVADVDNLSTDIIKNIQNTKQILKAHLLELFTESKVEKKEAESWD